MMRESKEMEEEEYSKKYKFTFNPVVSAININQN